MQEKSSSVLKLSAFHYSRFERKPQLAKHLATGDAPKLIITLIS